MRSVLGRERLAVDIDRRAADAGFGEVEREAEFALGRAEHAARFQHDFRSDAIAREDCDFEGLHKGGGA